MEYITTDKSVANAPCQKPYCFFKTPTGYCSQSYCVMEMEKTKRKSVQVLQYGWVCPKCGAVYSPNVSSCCHCTTPVEITCTY